MRRRLEKCLKWVDFWLSRQRLNLFLVDIGVIGIFAWRSQSYYAAALGPLTNRVAYFCLTLFVWLTVLAIFGFYDLRHWRILPTLNFLLRQPAKVLGGGFLLALLAMSIFVPPGEINLFRKAITALLIAGLTFGFRIGLHYLNRYCHGKRVTIIIVENRAAKVPVRRLMNVFCSDYYISAILTMEGLSWNNFVRPGGELVEKEELLEILYSISDPEAIERLKNMLASRHSRIILTPLADVLEQATGKIAPLERCLLPPSRHRGNPGYEVAKRGADILLSVLGLVIFLPFLPVLALMIKLDSPGPVLYRQRRVGRHGRIFQLIKLRSMVSEAERQTGAVWAKPDDPRATRVGKWLRQLHLDEIPQLINILKGEMSLVGPRPERPELVRQLTRSLPSYSLRLNLLPGLTGWAQINRPADNTQADVARKLDYDLYYLKNRSFLLDLRIILRTLDIVLFGMKAEASGEIASLQPVSSS